MDLFEASINGNLEVVKYLVESGENIHDKNISGNTSLMKASQYGQLEVVKYLLSCGANINYNNRNLATTSLLLASRYGHLEVVKYLVSSGANIHDKNLWGNTSLILALLYEHLKVIKYLCRQYIIKNIKPIDKEKEIIKKFININKLWIYYYNQRILDKHNKIILNNIDNRIDIHEDLIKYILKF